MNLPKLSFQALFLSFLLVFSSVNAEQTSATSVLSFVDSKNHSSKVSVTNYLNRNGELEVRIEASGIPRIASKINPLIGFGRDLNHNGKVDTWFILSKNGIELVKEEGNLPNGLDVLNKILMDKFKTSYSMYVSSVALSLFSYLSLSVNESVNIQEEYYQDWMDLEQLRIQADEELKNMTSAYTQKKFMFYSELISFGYKDLANKMDSFAKKSFWGYAFADIGLWISGGIVLRWVSKILANVGLIAVENAFINSVKEVFIGFFEKQKSLLETRINKMKSKTGYEMAKKEVAISLTIATYKHVLKNTLKAQSIKYKIHSKLMSAINLPKLVVEGAKKDWKYIAINSSVQIGTEALVRRDEIEDPNLMNMANNLFSNPEVQQNVGFMAIESIMMTGVSNNLKTFKAKFIASAAVALFNSSILNFYIKDGSNSSRVAFDIAWESLVGNTQVQGDLIALRYFEKMANDKLNPKIKLVGYAVAVIDMVAGYSIYSVVSSAIEKDKVSPEIKSEPKITLIPIFAEM